MNLETELVEITKDNLAEAQFMASNFIDVSVQNRIFFNVIGSEAIISYLEKLGVNTEGIASIHSIKRIVEKVDIADVILKNIHIDVRVIFNEYEIFIPKSHYDIGIVPDIYAVLKYDKSFQRINFIGFFEPSAINLNNCNGEYYFLEPEKLKSPFEMIDFINAYSGTTDKNLTEEQMLRGRELSVAVADHDVTDEEFNEFISLLLKSNSLRNAVLEYDNFETLASRVATALQVSKSNSLAQNEVVDFDDFVNMTDAPVDEVQDTASANEVKDEKTQDLNGDSLLDDVVDGVKVAGSAAGTIATVAGAVEGVEAFGTKVVSDEAIELAGMAGDVVADAAEELLDEGISDNIDETEVLEENIELSENLEEDAEIPDVDSKTPIPQNESLHDEVVDDVTVDDKSIDSGNTDLTYNEPIEDIETVEETGAQESEQTDLQSNDERNVDDSENIVAEDDIFGEDISDFPNLDLSEEDLTFDEISEDTSVADKEDLSSDVEIFEQENETDDSLAENIIDESSNEPEQQILDELVSDVEDKSDVLSKTEEASENQFDTDEQTLEPEQTFDSDDLTLNEEELNLGSFDADLNLDGFEDFITEEPSEGEVAACEDTELNDDIQGDVVLSDDTDISETESLIIEPDLPDDTDISVAESLIMEPDLSDDEENTVISEDESIENILKTDEETVISDEDKNVSDENSDTETKEMFDIGETLDVESDGFADIFGSEDGSDFDIGEISELPTGEVPNDPVNFESIDSEKHDANSETEDVENSEIEGYVSENDADVNISDNDLSSVPDDIESGDDDLIINDSKSVSADAFAEGNEEFKVGLEDISNAVGLELPEYVSDEKSPALTEYNDDVHDFDELPTEQVEEHTDSDEYGLVNFSDLEDTPTPEPYNAEVSFTDVEDFANFETVAPMDDNSEIDYFADDSAVDILLSSDTVKENSFVITDKNHNPGEIFIDINKDSSKVDISGSNEHLEELYNNNSTVITDDSGLNSETSVVNEKGKIIPIVLGVGGLALVIMIASIIILSVSKFMNPMPKDNEPLVTDNTALNNNLGNDVPTVNPDNSNVVMNDNTQPQSSVPQQAVPAANTNLNTQNSNVQQVTKPIPATSFLSVRKLSWEVPDYISIDSNFKQYFQSAGKSLKASLSSDLLLATDYTYSDQIRVSVLYNKDGSFAQAKILLSSGSAQVDNIVLQSVNQTLKVLKAPNSVGNDQSTTVILKIYL